MRGAVPNVGREGLADSSGARPGKTRNACPRGRSPTRGESGCRRPEIRSRRTFCRRPKRRGADAGGFPGPGNREGSPGGSKRRRRGLASAGAGTLARGSGRELPRRPGEGRRPEVRLRERPAPLGVFGMRLPKTPQPPARKPSGEKFRPAPSPGPADRGKQRREPPAFRAARGATGGSVSRR